MPRCINCKQPLLDFAAARLEISGPVAAGDLTADALPEGECILSWNIAALEVAS